MTQSAQSERAQTALKDSGITGSPLMSLERDDALFVLTDDMLVYQDGGGTRRVTLRDLTRIHSDQAGLLRVETPAGTALTASLLGFDVAQVQSFFKGVRSATARAKDLPDSPTPTLGGAKTFGTPPAVGSAPTASPSPAASPAPPKSPAPAASRGEGGSQPTDPQQASSQPASTQQTHTDAGARTGLPTPAPGTAADRPTTPSSTTPGAGAAEPGKSSAPASADRSAAPGGTTPTSAPTPEARKGGGNAENPVVISSSSFSPNVSRPGLGAGGVAPGGAAARPEAVRPDLRKPQPSAAAPTVARASAAATPRDTSPSDTAPSDVAPGVDTAPAATDAAVSPLPPAEPAFDVPVTALSRVAAATALARQAGTVEALAGRLRILGAVLFVGALALAFFQFTGDQALAGLWTLLSGGVGAIALLALGELAALLALLARVPGPAGTDINPVSDPMTDSGHDG